MRIRGAIFDLDGTVIDSMGVWDGAWERFCLKYSPVRDRALFAEYKTRTLRSAIEYYRSALDIPGSVDELCGEVNGYVLEGYRDVRAKPGAREYLSRLRERGVPACLATNTALPLVEFVLGRLDLRGYFDFILTCAQFGSGKDRPDIFLECARRLGSSPAETAVFEDAPHALATAGGAGFFTVAVHDNSYASHEQSLRALAGAYIYDFRDLNLSAI